MSKEKWMNIKVNKRKKAIRVIEADDGDSDANWKTGTFIDRAVQLHHRYCRWAQTNSITLDNKRSAVDDNVD